MDAETPIPPVEADLGQSETTKWIEAGPPSLLPAETFQLDSTFVGDTLEITVVLPEGASAVQAEGAIYVLDPIFNLKPVAAAVDMLNVFSTLTGASFPALTVVGMGYPAHDPMEVMALRARDLTPTKDGFPPEIGTPPVPHGFGGASHFLACLSGEVIPTVEERFNVPSANRILLGHSFGGLFSLYTLFHTPETFDKYIIVSPSIWWGSRIVFRYEEQWAKEHQDLPAHVFLAVGENEQLVGGTWKNERFPIGSLQLLRQVENLQELAERLTSRGYPNLSVDSEVFRDEYHLTVMPGAVTRGLLALFDNFAS